MSEMTGLVDRCVGVAIAVPDHPELGPDYTSIVRAVLAEAGVAEMREALQAAHDTMHECTATSVSSLFALCPFCGALDAEVRDLEDMSAPDAQFVQCNCCEAIGPTSRTDAISAWNRRTNTIAAIAKPTDDLREVVAAALIMARGLPLTLQVDAALTALTPRIAAREAAAVAKREAEIATWLREDALVDWGQSRVQMDELPWAAHAIERGYYRKAGK
jgi:Lar family restriction alleviation protein